MNDRDYASRKWLLSVAIFIAANVGLGLDKIGPQEWMWVIGIVGGGYQIANVVAKKNGNGG